VDSIKFTCFLPGELCIFHCYNTKSRLDNLSKDIADMTAFNGVGFDHGKSSVASHKLLEFCRKSITSQTTCKVFNKSFNISLHNYIDFCPIK